MKIIGLLSSPRKNSETKVLMDAVLKGAKENGADIEWIQLTDGEKYFAIVTTAGGEFSNTIKALSTQVGIFGRGYLSGGIGLAVKDKKAIDYNEVLEKCYILGGKLVSDIKAKKTFPLQNGVMRFFTWLIIRPQYKKVIIKNKDKGYKAIYQYLNEAGKI